MYSNPAALVALAARPQRPDFVWVAAWVAHEHQQDLDPYQAHGIPAQLWSGAGQRAWQYAGGPAVVDGLAVDISVADPGCLAGPPGSQPDPDPHPLTEWREVLVMSLPTLTEGASGQAVSNAEALLLARGFGPAGLLDHSQHPDGVFGPAMAAAVAAFQQAHRLPVSQEVDQDTWRALLTT